MKHATASNVPFSSQQPPPPFYKNTAAASPVRKTQVSTFEALIVWGVLENSEMFAWLAVCCDLNRSDFHKNLVSKGQRATVVTHPEPAHRVQGQ